ncbi:hypothetical protein DTO013E5_5052 [Penicillium roqueforti]|nr:hypothetical protein DTO012A1_3591 [Penicillium roqueforti]KAI2755535.1 hypothetical protein DTO013F2_1218 [Penicillium roqueforti]KAI3210767.1 hypothetical protein DTO013E5_5052 [Penicillium roqueforti]
MLGAKSSKVSEFEAFIYSFHLQPSHITSIYSRHLSCSSSIKHLSHIIVHPVNVPGIYRAHHSSHDLHPNHIASIHSWHLASLQRACHYRVHCLSFDL